MPVDTRPSRSSAIAARVRRRAAPLRTRSSQHERLRGTAEGLHVRIRQSKTDQDRAGDFVSIPHGSRLRPVAGLKAWLEAAKITEGPIFRSVKKGGPVTLERLSDRSVAQIVKKRAEAAGFDPGRDRCVQITAKKRVNKKWRNVSSRLKWQHLIFPLRP
jgi:hypothetical protein